MKNVLLAMLFLLCVPLGSLAQKGQQEEIRIGGTVTDMESKPIIGVIVQLKGTSIGTTTDALGQYALSVPAQGAVLIFSSFGYLTAESPVRGNQVDISLLEDQAQRELDEVVVVGYGQMRKRDITGAIASVSAEKLEISSPTNVFDALQGQVAGLQVVSGSGAPGENSMIRVRGTATFESGVAPLYVVDGVISEDIDDINPEDIQSIELLKDAASAAIYGSRSANGVFLITTKRGEKGRTQLNIRYLQSYSQLTRKMPKANVAERNYFDYWRRQVSGDRLAVENAYGWEVVDSLSNFVNQDMDLQDLIFRTALRREANITASGATDLFNYYINAGVLNEEGIIINTLYNRFTTRANSEYKPNKKLTVGNKTFFSYSENDGISESGVLNQLLERYPHWAIFNQDGSLVPNISSRRNPYAVAMTDVAKKQNYKATLNEYLNYKFNDRWELNTSLQATFSLSRQQGYRVRTQLDNNEQSTGTDYSTLNYSWSNENYLSYKRTFDRVHNVSAMAGMGFQSWHREAIRLVGLNYTTDEIYTLNAASDTDSKLSYTRIYEHTMASFFGRVGYDYKSKYLFNANMRYDGSSRFGKDRLWGFFPSASAAWRFSDETFTRWMKPLVGDGKIRISYGITGNESIPDYVAQLTYAPEFIYDGVAGVAVNNLPYQYLGWEETKQFNVGLDLFMRKGGIQLTVDYYDKRTDRLLNQVKIPAESGFTQIYMNEGAVSNKGFEVSLNVNLIRNKKFKWSADFNIAHNVTRIVKLTEGNEYTRGSDGALLIREGGKLGDFYGYKYLDIFAYDESNAFTSDWRQLTPVFNNGVFQHYLFEGRVYTGAVKQKTDFNDNILLGGDVNFEDMNGDGKIDASDRQLIGNAQPDFFGGVGTSLSWKRFKLDVQVYYSIGGDIYNYAESRRNQFRLDGATPSPEAIHNMWTKPGDIARWPAPIMSEHNYSAPSSFYIEDGSYIKLKNVRLTYDFPKKWIGKTGMKSAACYVYGRNLLTFTNYKGYDPEFNDSSDPLVIGIDPNKYPYKREFGFGVQLSF